MQKKDKNVIWRPYSQTDVNTLLSAVPLLHPKITAVRVTNWFNSRKKTLEFGIMVKGESGEWCHLCDGARAVIFDDIRLANKVCRAMKKELKSVPA